MIEALIEEVAKDARFVQRGDDLADVTRDFTDEMAALFVIQGELFVSKLERHKGKFAEAESPIANVWLALWDAVSRETSGAMEESVAEASAEALALGGEAAIAGLGLNLSWNLENPAALDYLEKNAARFVKNVDDTTKERLRVLIRDSAKRGDSYNELAKAITDAFKFMGEGATQRHIDSRAHLIAVTETGNAYEEAAMIQGRELKDGGIPMEKHWDTIGDARVSDGCKENQGAGWIELEDEWPAVDGTYDRQRPLRFPGCRCGQRIQVQRAWRQAAIDRYGIR